MNQTNLSRKAQLTFFILIGFVILIIMGIVFYVSKQQAERKTETQASLSQQSTYDLVTLKSFINTCLEKTAKDGMRLLGEQGGHIYPNQGGPEVTPPFEFKVDYLSFQKGARDYNVSYGLGFLNTEYPCELFDMNISCIGSLTEVSENNFEGSAYPWVDFSKPAGRECNNKDRGCFGKNNLPPLIGGLGMYAQLQVYINNTIDGCLDFSLFTGFKVEKNGTHEVNVTTTNETVVVVLKYPLNVVDITSRKMTHLDYFYYDTKIRLKQLHKIAIELVRRDENYENFDIQSDGTTLANQLAGDINIIPIIEVTKWFNEGKTKVNPNEDNVVILTDHFAGHEFIFQFARKNRPPVLDGIQSPINVVRDQPINESFFDTTLAYDPDDNYNNETIIRRYYSTEFFPLSIYPQENFKDTVEVARFCTYNRRNFTITVCVSDNISSVPQTIPCYTAGIPDKSRDWQTITFIITNCP